MRIGKITSVVCAAAMLGGILGGCGGKDNNSNGEESSVQKIVMESSNVKLVGRTYLQDETLWLALSGTGVDFTYTGKDLKITVQGDGAAQTPDNNDNYARVAVYVDGERVIDDMVDNAEEVYEVFKSDESKTVNVQVIKLSETAMSTVGIKPIEIAAGEEIKPAAAKAHSIEFIGDSITCGYGVDDEDKNHHFSTSTEDVTKAYAYKTAKALDADYSMFSVSGYGIISGYTDNDQPKSSQTIPQYYKSLGFSYSSFDGTAPQSLDWDFSKYQPEVVVINLGTNDDSYVKGDSDREAEYVAAYVEFLKTVRENNPDAWIFCTVGIMGTRIYSGVEDAWYQYTKETGDEKITPFKFEQQNEADDGLAADWHPTETRHQKASEELAAEIKSVMGW